MFVRAVCGCLGIGVAVLACGTPAAIVTAPASPPVEPDASVSEAPHEDAGGVLYALLGGDASPPPAAPPAPGIREAKDECTPVASEFEKRARSKLKACYAQGKKKDPGLEGRVVLRLQVDVRGKIKSRSISESTLPKPVAECMLKVVRETPFPDVDKCWDATITLPVSFPTPK
jgi:TonB family protein